MKYISTRGKCSPRSFEEVLLTGLAPDGGLFIPERVPAVDRETLLAWKAMPYPELAYEIIRLYTGDALPEEDLKRIVRESYAGFSHPQAAPLKALGENEWLLELYYGPTLAFKDFALQLLGRLLDWFLERAGRRVAILGATSGDTGSAALEGCKHSRFVEIFILHPRNRVSEVQRRQMTTVAGDNVHNLAIEGNFDDCQKIVKSAFGDQAFLPNGWQLAAVNSINWARIMAQIVYYFSAALKVLNSHGAVSFSVPTGNFGDIYAGYVAKKMGLPVKQLVIATNRNDILHRFISANRYAMAPIEPTLSPSMDIMVSSNFERFLYDLFDGDGSRVADFVTGLGQRELRVSEAEWERARSVFDSYSVDDEATCATIREVYERQHFLVDPHTATGIKAARECNRDKSIPMIILGTAHAAKFSEAISRAGLQPPPLPDHLADLYEREERYTVLPNSLDAVTDFIRGSLD